VDGGVQEGGGSRGTASLSGRSTKLGVHATNSAAAARTVASTPPARAPATAHICTRGAAPRSHFTPPGAMCSHVTLLRGAAQPGAGAARAAPLRR
jgi:hypothetical protein